MRFYHRLRIGKAERGAAESWKLRITQRPGAGLRQWMTLRIAKTTLLRIASGLLRPTTGTVRVGEDVTRKAPEKRARAGLGRLPEGRGIFASLSVRHNLELMLPPWATRDGLDDVVDIFPRLGERLGQRAGSLSGGEQQMLSLARSSQT